jgi:hypothetical protein
MTPEEMNDAEQARREYLELHEMELKLSNEFLSSEDPDPAVDTQLIELDVRRQEVLYRMNAALGRLGLTPFPWMSKNDYLLFLREGEDIPVPPAPRQEG